MGMILWLIAAVLGGLAFLMLAGRRFRGMAASIETEPGESPGRTPLEMLALRCLSVGGALAAVALITVTAVGPDAFYQRDALRITVTLLLLGALVVLSSVVFIARAWARRPRSPLDERDLGILERAPGLEGGAMIMTTALWVVGLQQTYWSAGAVPLVHLYLMFWSLLMVKAMALPVGVLIGYRKR